MWIRLEKIQWKTVVDQVVINTDQRRWNSVVFRQKVTERSIDYPTRIICIFEQFKERNRCKSKTKEFWRLKQSVVGPNRQQSDHPDSGISTISIIRFQRNSEVVVAWFPKVLLKHSSTFRIPAWKREITPKEWRKNEPNFKTVPQKEIVQILSDRLKSNMMQLMGSFWNPKESITFNQEMPSTNFWNIVSLPKSQRFLWGLENWYRNRPLWKDCG
jgi:hypothetical protein